MEEKLDIVELVDENGETVSFEHLATLEYEGDMYIVLMLLEEEQNDDEDGEVVVMKIENDEDGNECYVCVEDEDIQAAVFQDFLALMDEAEEDDE